MILDNEMVKRRAAAREQARAAAALVVEEAGRVAPDAQHAFWDEIGRLLPRTADKVCQTAAAVDEPMNDRQARAFGRSRMPFGKYQGDPVDAVPLEYLQKLCDPQPFVRMLRRYLASQRIAIEEEIADRKS